MSRIEEALLRRFSALQIVLFGVALGFAGVLPLLVYIALGPSDGNPIGLGLLAMAAVPIGVVVAGVGLIKILVQTFAGREQ